MSKTVSGFSKKTKEEKIDWLVAQYLDGNSTLKNTLKKYWNVDASLQNLHDDFIENTLTNYYLPFGIAPNFKINGSIYAIPMVIEESSVVAAASNAAKFWKDRGGFKAGVLSTQKNGQVHFNFFGKKEDIESYFKVIKPTLIEDIATLQKNMQKRGGGLVGIELKDSTQKLKGYYQLHCTFETLDAMGANFINSCLEQFAKTFEAQAQHFEAFKKSNEFPEVVMSILSNYVPNCLVKAEVSCKVNELANNGMDGTTFAENFVRAIEIAKVESHRAVTHNKGIMNGIDAVILATGNDFRAVEAGVHAYASRDGHYTSLTHAKVEGDTFTFWIEIPLALGTVGGLTTLHPLVKVALEILQKPSAKELMQLVAVAGLAQNFAAVRSLVTTGIQKGHMKMHLMNILNQLEATETEKKQAVTHFKKHTISHSDVVNYISTLRN
ncbi:MAG TPA: hydroxymethylglutaryl-CoA reductase, degradative [Flavobacteriaceae bacterium]|nr:hydroxymethylglutaryl-CoA reductase, degradative [Flavobacteriaceae bacterium]HAT66379.1 hydroxymethylglutaryl-CoA reductase, degradative [Flavobacteriaceae bacterium]|tara:strand:+ start:183637 stop:184950 length:1314 start_codon:yes stop_codon:yes gene_type:complete